MKKMLLSMLAGIVCMSSFAQGESHEYFYFSPQMMATHVKDYSEGEKAAIAQDLSVVRSVCFAAKGDNQEGQRPLYIATAGGPGARKTTILERFLASRYPNTSIAYLDPDQRALKFMVHTYFSQSLSAFSVANAENYSLAVKSAYERWRGASNYITLTLFEEAIAQRRNIAHGTTSTGGHIPTFLAKLKEADYDIVLVLCSCEDDFRRQAIQYRNEEQKFYQSTPEDAVSKGKVFPERMSAYFTYADTLYLYWSDDLFHPEHLAAVLTKGKMEVLDQTYLDKFVHKYENDRTSLLVEGKSIPSWNELVSLFQSRQF